jgi:hypothetical protein
MTPRKKRAPAKPAKAAAVRHKAAGAEATALATETEGTVSDAARHALALRIQRVAERELEAIERILDVLGPSDQPEADRCARTLAGISRTLREITALNTPAKALPADDSDDDTIPVDLDELRCELARRLNELVEARRSDPARGAE